MDMWDDFRRAGWIERIVMLLSLAGGTVLVVFGAVLLYHFLVIAYGSGLP